MFTATQDNPLATHLIMVDFQTKFVQATAIGGKDNRSLKYCVEDGSFDEFAINVLASDMTQSQQ